MRNSALRQPLASVTPLPAEITEIKPVASWGLCADAARACRGPDCHRLSVSGLLRRRFGSPRSGSPITPLGTSQYRSRSKEFIRLISGYSLDWSPGGSESVKVGKPPDSVEEGCFRVLRQRGSAVATMFVSATSLQVAAIGGGIGISLASLRRFWAVAARWNSSRAPLGPRSRSRSSFRIRFR